MSAASAPGLGGYFRPVPPQKGSFPLDHDGECQAIVQEYLKCLKLVDGSNAPTCRKIAQRYLQCRMDYDLMDKDDMRNLGFQPETDK